GNPIGSLPPGWAQWSNQAPATVAPDRSSSEPKALRFEAGSSNNARAWFGQDLASDVRVTASILLDSLIPAEVIVRVSQLDSTTPSYYAVSVERGLDVTLWRVVNGVRTRIDHLRSADYLSGQWVRVTLQAQGDTLQAQITRLDSGLYL